MDDTHSHFTLYGKSPLFQLFFSLLIILVVGIFLLLVLILAGAVISGEDFATFINYFSVETGGEESIIFIRYLVISQGISLFIVPAIIIISLMKPDHRFNLMILKTPGINEVVLVIILACCVFPITSFTGQLNSSMHLPDWLSGVEKWMQGKESNATRLTDLLMTSETFRIMLLNVLMIAVIPAVGEELIFRGVFQNIFYRFFRSGYMAIWVTAIMFSAIHFQFFGFVPRLILGLVFGYLYFWSRSLWLPVISHFINNAVPVMWSYLHGWDKLNETADIPLWKQMIVLPLPVLVSILILLYFRNKSSKESKRSLNESGTSEL
jgi:membrane protease YdiL (CAAX protease family)